MSLTIRDALREGSRLLAAAGSDEAALEAELLLEHALSLDRVHFYQRLAEELTPQQAERFRALLDRRLAHESTAYILGHREFFELELEVTPAAIIPRPETETLVELVIAFARERFGEAAFTMADVGAGCGAIAVAVAHELPQAQVIAIDVSPEALALAERNARRHGVAGRIRFLEGDLLEPLRSPSTRSPPIRIGALRLRVSGGVGASRRVDVIAANLPYVRTADWERLPPEIRDHEPRSGLDGGPDGLRLIERLLQDAPNYLKPGGALFVEIGDEQGQAASELARRSFPDAQIEVKPDLAGFDRVLVVVT